MDHELLQRFVTLWVVVDPLGTLPVFLALSEGLSGSAQRSLALRAAATAFGVLAGFALFGRALLDLLEISLESFRIAGGVVLLLFALHLIFGEEKHRRDLASSRDLGKTAVFPLAIPSMASPGAMLAATLTAHGAGGGSLGAPMTLALLAGVLITAAAILMAAAPIHRVIGDAGAAAASRVMGVILAAVAVDEVLRGLVHIGALPEF